MKTQFKCEEKVFMDVLFLTASSQLNQGKTSAAAVQQQVIPSQSQRGHTEPGDLQRVRESKQQAGDDQAFHQARVIQLEGQVQHQGTFIAAVFLPSTCRV